VRTFSRPGLTAEDRARLDALFDRRHPRPEPAPDLLAATCHWCGLACRRYDGATCSITTTAGVTAWHLGCRPPP
jgi:hypothetical protein